MQNDKALRQELAKRGQQILVLQGGGALGAYQAGVFQALDQAGIELDWVIGTSIGAINAAIIAGNPPTTRMERLRQFWKRVEHSSLFDSWMPAPVASAFHYWTSVVSGIPGFFTPQASRAMAPWAPLSPDEAGFYSTDPLRATLSELVDFDRIAQNTIRLTVGASNVRSGAMVYFDCSHQKIDVRHILASGALPPAFAPVPIDGDLFWDGGILSNTPIEAVFDDMPRRDGMIYAVDMWNANGSAPSSMWEVMSRLKDIQYASRSTSQIERQRQLHRLRHVITELGYELSDEQRARPDIRELLSYGCTTRMHLIPLLAPRLAYEDQGKDMDFSAAGIAQRWEAGYSHTMRALEAAPWRESATDLEGIVLHSLPSDSSPPAS